MSQEPATLSMRRLVSKGDLLAVEQELRANPEKINEKQFWAKYSMNLDNATPLTVAAEKGNAPIAKLLIERGANLEEKGHWQHTPLMTACLNSNMDVARLLLEAKADVNALGGWNDGNALWQAVSSSSPSSGALVQLLLQHGVNVNQQDCDGNTCLHFVCTEGNIELVLLLAAAGADLTIKNKLGETALACWKAGVDARKATDSESSINASLSFFFAIVFIAFLYLSKA